MDYLCSQTWLPTVQEVLHADWQDAGHSPQPPVRSVLLIIALLTVLTCFFILNPPWITVILYFTLFSPNMQGFYYKQIPTFTTGRDVSPK
jgi:hypothetical protein